MISTLAVIAAFIGGVLFERVAWLRVLRRLLINVGFTTMRVGPLTFKVNP